MALRPALGGEGCGDLPCWVVVGAISCAGLTSASRTTPVMLSVWPLSEVNVFSFTPQRSLPHQQSRATCDEQDKGLELVALSRDCIWAPWTVWQPLLGHSSTQHLSSVLCGFPVGSVQWAPKGRMAVGRGRRWTEALGEDGGGGVGVETWVGSL